MKVRKFPFCISSNSETVVFFVPTSVNISVFLCEQKYLFIVLLCFHYLKGRDRYQYNQRIWNKEALSDYSDGRYRFFKNYILYIIIYHTKHISQLSHGYSFLLLNFISSHVKYKRRARVGFEPTTASCFNAAWSSNQLS